MTLILHIDTATEVASIALSDEAKILHLLKNENQRDHAAWIHPAIREIFNKCDQDLSDLKAISVTEGPGSYTGLRVGMATAKGLSFALRVPLITESTLRVMAGAASKKIGESNDHALLLPMIDARRMEVFAAAYDHLLNEVVAPAAFVLDVNSFKDFETKTPVYYFGSGSEKFRALAGDPRFTYLESLHDAADLAPLVWKKYLEGDFADLAYSEPAYLKEFYTHNRK